MRHFIDGKRIAFDTETTGLRVWHGDQPFAFSFANENLETAYFEFPVDPFTRKVDLRPKWVARSLERIRILLEDESIEKVGHNVKFDVRMAATLGIHVAGDIEETICKAHLCNNLEPAFGLKPLATKLGLMGSEDQDLLKKSAQRCRLRVRRLGWKIASKEDNGQDKDEGVCMADYWLPRRLYELHPEMAANFEEGFLEKAAGLCEEYAVNDAIRTIAIDAFYSQMMDELDVRELYEKVEKPLWDVVYRMETRGAMARPDGLSKLQSEAETVMAEILPRLRKRSWDEFDPKNPNHVRDFLYKILQLPITKMTKGGKYGRNKKPAADKDVLEEHKDVPEVWDIVVYNGNQKAINNFYSKYEDYYVPESGGLVAIHASLNPNRARTGRFSSSDPNLQQVTNPATSHSLYCVQVRPGLGPRPGYVWVCTDYDGMEVRMFAGISHEPTMLSAIEKGVSIHDEMTNAVWGGQNNEEAIKRAIRALGIDGSGINNIRELADFWKEMKWDDRIVAKMSTRDRYEIAEHFLSRFGHDIVKAEAHLGRKNSKGNIKMLTFLKIYGGGAEKAAKVLKCPVVEARRILDLYNKRFPRVNGYSKELISEAKANGYITTLWGRRLGIDPEKAYKAVNYIIQGSSADLMKDSMVKIDRWHQNSGKDWHLILQVHDELITEIPKSDLTVNYIKTKQKLMSDSGGRLPIPMLAESQVAPIHWGDKRKIKL